MELDGYRFGRGSGVAIGGNYEHVAKSEERDQIVQRSLDWGRMRRFGRGDTDPVLDVAGYFPVLPAGLWRRIVIVRGFVDLHAQG